MIFLSFRIYSELALSPPFPRSNNPPLILSCFFYRRLVWQSSLSRRTYLGRRRLWPRTRRNPALLIRLDGGGKASLIHTPVSPDYKLAKLQVSSYVKHPQPPLSPQAVPYLPP